MQIIKNQQQYFTETDVAFWESVCSQLSMRLLFNAYNYKLTSIRFCIGLLDMGSHLT